ncbi:thiamine pyrophosphate-dependent enzyme [Candidatus Albibeggiatoa sp. nov. NOAA]|uniref:thiamine pyrophosphate-dependent enzyme n=1 Tax=Candidatus Albibeggiatoa sp. nov. NOAA TaxID=3162724 RepID=UPI0033018743|nr:thiamine pyrophosphate-dependent enzyme [Thiotrichaceae bacterium]
MSPEQLTAFEQRIANIYEQGKIKAPIHLRDGNEQQLIDIFKEVNKQDYVFSTWASHLHALLKGIPSQLIEEKIVQGDSITLCFPEYHFYTSAIVGGIAPMALGVALGFKRKQIDNQHVWCFIGDMTYFTGIVQECIEYAENFQLPITFVVEDNGVSVCSPTQEVWGRSCKEKIQQQQSLGRHKNVRYFDYSLSWPHSGIGKFIHF